MKKPTKLMTRLLPGIILGFIVILGMALLGDLQKISDVMSRFDWWVYPFALLLTLLNYILRFFKWHYYLHQVGGQLPWLESLRLFVAGFPLAVTPGKVGEALKGVWLNRLVNVPLGKGISIVAAERISDGLAVLILSTLGVIAYPSYWPAFAFILGGLLAAIIVIQIRPFALWILGLCKHIPFVHRFADGLYEFYEGSFALFRPRSTFIALGLGTISWLGEGVGFYFILIGLGLPATLETLSMAVFILSFSTVIGAVSALPGGLGAAELSIAGMLSLLMGMEPALATSATVLIRLATLWFGVALGLLTWIISPDLLGLQVVNDAEPMVNR